MKKTLLVTLDFYPQTGGIAQYWKHLGVFFDPQKWVVLAPPVPVGSKELKTPYGIYRKKFFSNIVFPHWIPSFFHIWNIIKKENIETVVVSHMLPLGTVMFCLHFFTKTPYVIVSHGMDAALPLRNTWKKLLCSVILKKAHAVFANSIQTSNNLQKLGCPNKKIHIIYPCPALDEVPSQTNTTRSKELLEIVKHKKVLLSVSRLVKRKGHEYILLALPDLIKKYPDVVYIIVGDGLYRKHLEQKVVELDLKDYVFFCGELLGNDIITWYKQCELFILTPFELSNNDTEGFGMVYLEANSFAKPVIGSKCGGVSEAVVDGNTGILVDQKNSTQITKAIVQLLDYDDYAKKLGLNGKERVEKEFHWSQVAKKYEEILRN